MKKYIISFIAVFAIIASGCTDLMEDMNNAPKSLTNERLAADGVVFKQYINTMETNLFELTSTWKYQIQQNLNADMFGGYTMPPNNFSNTQNHNYNWNNGWNDYIFTVAQTNLSNFLALENLSKGQGYEDFYAYGLILKVMAALPVVDAFGPFPYLKYGKEETPAFDDVQAIYEDGFLPELDTAIAILEKYAASDAATRVANSGADLSNFGGNIESWIKVANTLKLRLAMRISNADESKANACITEVLKNSYGVLDSETGDFAINCAANNVTNPFHYLSTKWNNCAMSADMQSFLVGMNDPRIAAYFLEIEDGGYVGIRPGSDYKNGTYTASLLNVSSNFMWISGAESYFLLAEAAQRGLGGLSSGDAKSYYESGVNASFVLRGLTESEATTYLASTATPADYVDSLDSDNSYTATTDITPQWDDSRAIEQIITQKWIAMYPLGCEAWAEFRRTGYPKLVIPTNMATAANFDGTLQAGEYLKRLPYASNILSLSADAAQTAVDNYLNGKDDAAQSLWWDVD